MKRLFSCLLFCSAILGLQLINAQPLPCGENPEMMPTCEQACIICDIDGFNGVNNSSVDGIAPDGFCTTIVHNITWLAFIAGTENITIEVAVGECQNIGAFGNGLEVAIYESLDCEATQLVSNCDGNIYENTASSFSNTQPLTIGQYYYFVMDGDGGAICNYQVNVLAGSTQVDPLNTSGFIEGFTQTCPDITNTYSTTGVIGAIFYDWTIDGVFFGDGESIDISWDTDGVYELCVTASNTCDEATPTCEFIFVESIPSTIIEEILCEGECLETLDGPLCQTGNYEFNFITEVGCDSLVFIDLTIYPNPITNIALNMCEGDTLFVGNTPYFDTGIYSTAIPNIFGCDSTINLNLNLIICEINTDDSMSPVLCHGENSGSITFSVQNGTPPFTYTYELLGNTGISGNGNIANLNESIALNNLFAGTYAISINDNYGNDAVIISQVSQPTPLTFEVITSDYNGFNISCTNQSDGWMDLIPSGGTVPYSYSANSQIQTNTIQDLSAGTYEISLSDDNDCISTQSITLIEPDELQVQGNFFNASCEGLNSGQAEASIEGGTMPYLYSLNNSPWQEEATFSGLGQDFYELSVQDANGCIANTEGNISAPRIPIFDLGTDTSITLGEEISLFDNYLPFDFEITNIEWTSADIESLSCTDCLNPIAFPVNNTTYYLSLTSIDNCSRQDSITVLINKIRTFRGPTAFTPNGDGLNDLYYFIGGKDIKEVRTFKVFSRWGQNIFEQNNFPPNDASFGWDGSFQNKKLEMGVYVWYAEVEYIDGERVVHKGNVTLIR